MQNLFCMVPDSFLRRAEDRRKHNPHSIGQLVQAREGEEVREQKKYEYEYELEDVGNPF
jgi:hypothetical protein